MKRRLCALGLALILSLTACGGEKTPTQSGTSSQEPVSVPAAPVRQEETRDPFSGTYWTAVLWELEDEATGEMESSASPTEMRWADLWLNEDGSVLYREVINSFYTAEIHDGQWQAEGNDLHLTASDPEAAYPTKAALDGCLENDTLVFEYNSRRLYLEQAEPPAPGGELCVADVQGTWKQTGVQEDSLAACLYVDEYWADWDSGYQPTATLYTAEKLDYYVPEYDRYEDLKLEVLDTPIEGLTNQCWSLRLYNGDAEFLVTLTDMDTLHLRGADGQTGIFQRVNDRLPDEVATAMTELPADASILYWADPGDIIRYQLDFWPLIKMENSCRNRVLIVSCWEGLQVQICNGTPQMNENGLMERWITDEPVYETTLGQNEPLWLGMNLPEGTAELCLFFKLPYQETWQTWPLTRQEPYYVKDPIYFTRNG